MPEFDSTIEEQLAERQATSAEVMIWITARNRETDAPESIGFWTGDDHRDFVIGGDTRTYLGAGSVIETGPLRATIGLDVMYFRVTMPPFLDEVRQALKVYDPRHAPVEVHSVVLHPETGRPLGPPKRRVKGVLHSAPESLGGKNEASETELVIATSVRFLTNTMALYRSNAALQDRDPTDRGREYSDVAGEWRVPWGDSTTEAKSSGSSAKKPAVDVIQATADKGP